MSWWSRFVSGVAAAWCAIASPMSAPAQWPHPLSLGEVGSDQLAGLVISGSGVDDELGYSAAACGDVNGDGVDDLVLGARGADPLGRTDAGAAYVVLGSRAAGALRGAMAAELIVAPVGRTIAGAAAGELLGISVAGVGDVDGDGHDDLLVGAPLANAAGRTNAGSAWLLFGGPAWGSAATLDLAAPPEGAAVLFLGASVEDLTGTCVAAAGDVNGDGLSDLLLGAPRRFDSSTPGAAWLIYGSASWRDVASVDLATQGTNVGVRIGGITPADSLGESVAAAGDVNGDGIDDLLVGALRAVPLGRSQAGAAYVVYGAPGGIGTAGVLMAADLDGTTGFQVHGAAAFDQLGVSVAGAGDVDGDGFADILLGARGLDPGGVASAGGAYIVFGAPSAPGSAGILDLAAATGNDALRLDGIGANDEAGLGVAAAGDLDLDGHADVLIGAREPDVGADPLHGEAFWVRGSARTEKSPASLSLAALDGSNGGHMEGVAVFDRAGFAVAGPGDLDGDGAPEAVIGAFNALNPGATLGGRGVAYLLAGRRVAGSATYRAHAAPKAAPWRAIGAHHPAAAPASRVWVRYQDGAGPGPAGASLETVTLHTGVGVVSGVPATPARVVWEWSTDRTAWTEARVRLRFTDTEVAGLRRASLQLHQGPTADGPWTLVVDAAIQHARNEVTATLTSPGFLVLAGEGVPPEGFVLR